MILMKLNTPTKHIKVDLYQEAFFFEEFILPGE